MAQVLDLCQPDTPSSSSENEVSSPHQATFLVQLALALSSPEAAAQPAARSVLLQVAISYTSSICYAVDDSALLDEVALDSAAHDDEELELPAAEKEQQQQAEQALHSQQHDQPSEASQPQQQQQRLDEPGQSASYEVEQYPPVLHDHPDGKQLQGSPTASPSRTNTQAEEPRVAPAVAAAAAGGNLGSAAAAKEEAAVPLTAELCVKVIRACGLQVRNSPHACFMLCAHM